MPESNTVVQHSLTDLKAVLSLAQGNTVLCYRLNMEKIQRRLPLLQRQLDSLRSQETIIKTRIYNTYGLDIVTATFKAAPQQTINPIQSFTYFDPNMNGTAQNLSYSLAQLERSLPGLKDLRGALDSINYQISKIQGQINDYNNQLTELQAAIGS